MSDTKKRVRKKLSGEAIFEDPGTAPPMHENTAPDDDGGSKSGFKPDITRRSPVEQAKHAKELEDAFHFQPVWQGNELLPFGFGRQALARRLALNNAPIPLSQQGEDLDAHMPDAWCVLYLCSHTEAEYAALRGDPTAFWCEIEKWAEESCPRSLWLEALNLVGQMWEYCRKTEATTPRHPTRPHVGN